MTRHWLSDVEDYPVGDGFYRWCFRGAQCGGAGADDQSVSGTWGGLEKENSKRRARLLKEVTFLPEAGVAEKC